MLFGISINLPRNIGIAFNTRDRIQLYTRLGRNASELAFLGSNASYFPFLRTSSGDILENPRNPRFSGNAPLTEEQQASVVLGFFDNPDDASTSLDILEGSRISASWYREFNFSIGARVYDSYNLSVYAGVGYREIRGLMNVDIDIVSGPGGATFQENYLALATGLIDFDEFSIRQGVGLSDFLFPSGVAKGRAIDLGMTFVIKRNLYVGASLTNLGSITSGDITYSIGSSNIEQFGGGGFNSYNVISSGEDEFAVGGERSPIDWQEQEARTVDLPSTFRFGSSYEYLNTLHLGFDVVVPLNNVGGNLEDPLYAIGGEYRLNKLLRLSSGVNIGGNNGGKVNIPMGLTYTARKGKYEAGVATRDLVTFLSNTEGSTLSLATGFLRFKLGKVPQK